MSSNIQKAFKTKSKLRGMADGGIMEENVGGVRTFSDRRAAGSGARAYTPSGTAGNMSVVGMAPAQRAAMDASIASNRAGAAQAHEQRMGRAPDPTTALANALNKAGTPPAGGTPAPGTAPAPAPATASPLRAPVHSLPPITVTPPPAAAPVHSLPPVAVTPPPATAAAVPQLPTTTVFPPSAATGEFEEEEDFYMQTPRFRDGGMHETHEPMIDGTRGGPVRGPGGPTDDKVGPVALSDGEYVLPADTVDIVGRENLDALRLATHDFTDDGNKPKVSGLRKMANGGPFYVDPEGVASRQRPPGRGMVPYQPPAPAAPASAAPASAAPASAPPARPSRFAAAARLAGNVLIPATAAYDAATDSPEARNRAASGQEGVAGVASKVGSYLASPLSFGTSSPQDIGAFTSALRGEGTGAYHAVPDAEKGWARRIGERVFPTESARIMSDRVQLSDDAQSRADLLKRHGFDLGNMSEDDHARAREILSTPQSRSPELPGMSNVPADTRVSSAGAPAVPVQPQSYQSRRLAEMGVPVDQQNLAPVTDDTRRSLLREGGGTPGQYVNLGSYGGDANIYGTASEPGGRIDSFTGVGASSRPDGGPQEDPIMSEIRSALRGLTDGAGNRGGSSFSGRGRGTNAINQRYDDMLRRGRGRNPVRGSDWSQRHGLSVEAARAKELGEYAQNQSTLRGQDMTASTAANSANMQARMQALQTLGTMTSQRGTQGAQAATAAAAAARDGRDTDDNRAVRAVGQLDDFLTQQYGEESPEGAEFARAFRATNPEFMTMPDGDRASLLAQFKEQWDAQRAIRERAASLERPIGIGLAGVDGTPSEVRVGDWWNNRATFGDWMESFNIFGENDRTAVRIPAGDGDNMLVSERDLITRPDGSKRAEVISRLRNREGER